MYAIFVDTIHNKNKFTKIHKTYPSILLRYMKCNEGEELVKGLKYTAVCCPIPFVFFNYNLV